MKNLIFICVIVITSNLYSQGIKMTVRGNWRKNIAASDISEAGNDYPGSYTSKNNQTLITITPKNKGKMMYVYVHKEDITWNSVLHLKVRRSGKGITNNTNINGGTSFQLIANNDANFFECSGIHKKIPIQYEITGISVVLPVQDYSTTIYYTVMNY